MCPRTAQSEPLQAGGGGEEGRRGWLHIQRAGTMTAPSAVVSLQRPPPPLIFSVRTEEQEEEERWHEERKRHEMSDRGGKRWS